MRFDHEYVSGLLAPSGFIYRYRDDLTKELRLTRRASDDLFQQAEISEGWQRGFSGYIIGSGVSCTIVPGRTFLKGMGEYVPLLEIAGEQGWMQITSEGEFQRWADRLAAIAPARAAELTERIGPTLLANTRQAREAAIRYCERCMSFGTIQQAKAALESQATADQLRAVRTMLHWPPVFIDNGLIYYEVAALAMILYAKELDEYSTWLDAPDPEEDRQIMIRLQVLASRLAKEPGW